MAKNRSITTSWYTTQQMEDLGKSWQNEGNSQEEARYFFTDTRGRSAEDQLNLETIKNIPNNKPAKFMFVKNLGGGHWVGIAVTVKNGKAKVSYSDSLNNANITYADLSENAKEFMNNVSNKFEKGLGIDKVTKENYKYTWQQKDSNSCGPFTIENMRRCLANSEEANQEINPGGEAIREFQLMQMKDPVAIAGVSLDNSLLDEVERAYQVNKMDPFSAENMSNILANKENKEAIKFENGIKSLEKEVVILNEVANFNKQNPQSPLKGEDFLKFIQDPHDESVRKDIKEKLGSLALDEAKLVEKKDLENFLRGKGLDKHKQAIVDLWKYPAYSQEALDARDRLSNVKNMKFTIEDLKGEMNNWGITKDNINNIQFIKDKLKFNKISEEYVQYVQDLFNYDPGSKEAEYARDKLHETNKIKLSPQAARNLLKSFYGVTGEKVFDVRIENNSKLAKDIKEFNQNNPNLPKLEDIITLYTFPNNITVKENIAKEMGLNPTDVIETSYVARIRAIIAHLKNKYLPQIRSKVNRWKQQNGTAYKEDIINKEATNMGMNKEEFIEAQKQALKGYKAKQNTRNLQQNPIDQDEIFARQLQQEQEREMRAATKGAETSLRKLQDSWRRKEKQTAEELGMTPDEFKQAQQAQKEWDKRNQQQEEKLRQIEKDRNLALRLQQEEEQQVLKDTKEKQVSPEEAERHILNELNYINKMLSPETLKSFVENMDHLIRVDNIPNRTEPVHLKYYLDNIMPYVKNLTPERCDEIVKKNFPWLNPKFKKVSKDKYLNQIIWGEKNHKKDVQQSIKIDDGFIQKAQQEEYEKAFNILLETHDNITSKINDVKRANNSQKLEKLKRVKKELVNEIEAFSEGKYTEEHMLKADKIIAKSNKLVYPEAIEKSQSEYRPSSPHYSKPPSSKWRLR